MHLRISQDLEVGARGSARLSPYPSRIPAYPGIVSQQWVQSVGDRRTLGWTDIAAGNYRTSTENPHVIRFRR